MDNAGGDADHSIASVATLALPASASTPSSIPGFELIIITSSMLGAIVIYVFYKKRRN